VARGAAELLHGAREVVVGVERAAVGLGPAILAGELGARARSTGHAAQRIPDALHALVVVGRRRTARLDADGAAVRLDLHGDLGEVDADLVVVGADIGGAQVHVLRQHVRVPGQHRDPGVLGGLQRHGHRRGIGRRHADALHIAAGDEVLDDLHLFVATAVLARADVFAYEGTVRLGFGLLAAVARLIEERVVHVLRHQREDVLRLHGRGERRRHHGDRSRREYPVH
jgi:hypothetical protein